MASKRHKKENYCGIGYVELGEGIGHFLTKIKAQTGNDFALFVRKDQLDREEWARRHAGERDAWDDLPGVVVARATSADPIVDAAAVALAEGSAGFRLLLEEVERGSTAYARGVFPVRDASGTVVGGLVVRRDITGVRTVMRTDLVMAIVFMALLAAVASLMVFLLVDRLIFGRLRAMISTMEELTTRRAGGDYGFRAGARPPAPPSGSQSTRPRPGDGIPTPPRGITRDRERAQPRHMLTRGAAAALRSAPSERP